MTSMKDVALEPIVGGKLACIACLHVDDAKVKEYLLNASHKLGSAKAKYFLKRGFTLEDWKVLRDALVQHAQANRITSVQHHPFGKKIVVECNLRAPKGDDHCIRAVWNCLDDGSAARLITAHPL